MISKWSHLKPKAISLRKRGKSIGNIERLLDIPRSTLSGWFRHVKLTESQKAVLKRKHEQGLIKARKVAVLWHNKQKQDRLKSAEIEAEKTLAVINQSNENTELALALLYLGEGSKGDSTGMGNSDPLILKFFLKTLRNIYGIKIENIGAYLHLRADQNPELMKKYWSKELNIPIDRFGKTSVDIRTAGKKTYSNYKGVCVIECGNVAIQRKLVYISRKFCERTVMRD